MAAEVHDEQGAGELKSIRSHVAAHGQHSQVRVPGEGRARDKQTAGNQPGPRPERQGGQAWRAWEAWKAAQEALLVHALAYLARLAT